MGDPNDEDFEINATHLSQRRMKHFASTLNHFWSRWRTESQRKPSKLSQCKKATHSPHVSTEDIVIVRIDSLLQGLWKLGKS